MESTDQELLNAVVTPYNLTDEQEKKEIVRHYRALLRTLRTKLKKGDRELLRTAFEMATEAHKTMRRKSGEPYILHPIAVAMIAADEIGLSNGTEEKLIATNNIPQHQHDLTGAGGTQFYAVTDDITGSSGITDSDSVGRSVQMQSGLSKLLTTSGDVSATSTDVPLNVMNPFLTINYIIFTGRIV
jgi:GTP pyrophosphokinase